MIKIGSLIFSILLFVSSAFGEITVQATVDRNELAAGEAFTLKVNVSSDQSVPVNQPSLPTISGVEMLHNWVSSQSRSSVISRGQGLDFKTIKTKIFNYQFSTLKPGAIKIDPVRVTISGKTYATKPITIKVLEPGSVTKPLAQQRRQQRPSRPSFPQSPIDELEKRFNQLLNRQFGGLPDSDSQSFMTAPGKESEAFFIRAEVDKTDAYKGEQILASWYLYTRGRVRDIDTLKYPTLKGFWKEDIQISTHHLHT
ncbi:MAG: BatD family protein [Pseudomonadota bacterium]